MKFINFQKWMEEEAAAAAPAPTTSTSASNTVTSNSSGGTMTTDVAKLPNKLGCVSCSKDFKNWYRKRRKTK